MCQILSTKQTNKDETKGMNNKNEKKIKDSKTERKINTCHWTYQYKTKVQKPEREYINVQKKDQCWVFLLIDA
jgi:hypothetical protein